MPNLKEALSDNLKRILSDKGISQSELAKKLDVSFQTINAIINARGGTTWATLSKIAQTLGVEETDLVAVQKHLPETVELRKQDWDHITELLTTLSDSSIPQDILNEISELEPKSRNAAFVGFRLVLDTVKNGGKKGQGDEVG